MFKATEENITAQHKFYFQNCFGVKIIYIEMYAFMYAERLKLHTTTAKKLPKKLPNKKLTDIDWLE